MRIDNYYIKNDNIIDLSRILDRGQVQGFDQDRLSNNIGGGYYEGQLNWNKDAYRIREIQENISYIDSHKKGLETIRSSLKEFADRNTYGFKKGLFGSERPSRKSDYILRSPIEFESDEGHFIYNPYSMEEGNRFREKFIRNRLAREKLLKKIEVERKELYFSEDEVDQDYGEYYQDLDLIASNRLLAKELQVSYHDISIGKDEVDPGDNIAALNLEDRIKFIDDRKIKLNEFKDELINELRFRENRSQKKDDIREFKEKLDLIKLNILEDKILLRRIKKVHNRELVYQLLK